MRYGSWSSPVHYRFIFYWLNSLIPLPRKPCAVRVCNCTIGAKRAQIHTVGSSTATITKTSRMELIYHCPARTPCTKHPAYSDTVIGLNFLRNNPPPPLFQPPACWLQFRHLTLNFYEHQEPPWVVSAPYTRNTRQGCFSQWGDEGGRVSEASVQGTTGTSTSTC